MRAVRAVEVNCGALPTKTDLIAKRKQEEQSFQLRPTVKHLSEDANGCGPAKRAG